MPTHTTTPHGRPRLGWTAALGALVLLGAGMSSSCNDHMVLPFLGPDWDGGRTFPTDVASEVDMDILWVVDNSGSMCQEQKALRENFDAFITTLDIALLDFHIAVTTTHAPGKDSSYRQEPVAIEGHIQSTPQPIPGFEAECIGTYDAGERVFTDFAPTRDALAVAVSCMAEPDARLLEVTDAQLNCAHPDSTTPGCAEATGAVDRDGDGVFSLGDVFPLASEYRAIPKVLRAQDYSTGDRIDVERLRADFACMSMVGTRGYGVEKGLQAAVEAVSPELTGLVPESPSADIDAPNHGFLRRGSAFTLIFVTDENDCSHDGGIDESPTQTCGPSICDYENAADLRGEASDLTGIPTLAGRLRNNLAESKGRDVQESEILVASIHGLWNPYEGATPVCEDFDEPSDLPGASPACDTELGQAFSGDRYDRFMRQFPNYYPNAVTGGDEEKRLDFENFQEFGEICTGDFSASLRAIGEFIGDAPGACITDRVYPCEATSECPAPLFGDAEPMCRADLGVEGFCDTGIILRLLQSDDGPPIEENAYCIPESINAMRTERPSCVVDPSRYDWVPCSANGGAITFEWVGASAGEVTRELAGYELEVVYNARFGGARGRL